MKALRKVWQGEELNLKDYKTLENLLLLAIVWMLIQIILF